MILRVANMLNNFSSKHPKQIREKVPKSLSRVSCPMEMDVLKVLRVSTLKMFFFDPIVISGGHYNINGPYKWVRVLGVISRLYPLQVELEPLLIWP